MNVHFNLEHRFMKKEWDYVTYMDYRPDYSDKNFIGARSIFASILYFILACFNYFLAFAYFAFIRELYSNHAKISSILICCFICYNLFFLIRELNFKILHWCGYHALPELVKFGSGSYSFHLPVFERHTKNYKVYYSKRSKKHQFLFFVSYILYVNLILGVLLLFSCAYWDMFIESSSEFQNWHALLFIFLIIILYFCIEALFKKYKLWFKNYFKLDDKIVEHGFPIYALKEK